MNLTVALLAGLFLLLPGLTALATWNRLSSRHGARRPELPLTSVSALFIAFAVSILAHILGGIIVELIVQASHEAGKLAPHHWPADTTLHTPMRAVMDMVSAPPAPLPSIPPTNAKELQDAIDAAKAAAEQRAGEIVAGVWMMIAQVLAECVLVFFFVSSRGVELLIDRMDLQGQGWVYKSVVRPHRHGYTPVAYVLTALTNGKDLGVGYRGIVAELRQGVDGELKVISLAKPDAFVYELGDGDAEDHDHDHDDGDDTIVAPAPLAEDETGEDVASEDLRLRIHPRRKLEGVMVLEAATVRNILINTVKPSDLDALEAKVRTFKLAEAAGGETSPPPEPGPAPAPPEAVAPAKPAAPSPASDRKRGPRRRADPKKDGKSDV